MKRILVPTDFSAPSKRSFRFAIDLALKDHADVYVVHMIQLPLLPETTFGIQPYPSDPELLQKATATAHKLFEEMKKQFPSEVTVHFKTMNSEVVRGMGEYVQENNIDLIVISTHGISNLEEFLIGSTAEKITRFSTVPVISIPKEIKLDSIRSIVFPSTMELDQDDLMNDLKHLQKLFNAKLHVLLVNTPDNFYNEQQARKILERFAKYYELHDFTLNFRSHQFERSGILEFMNEIRGDMVAMATHGRTGLSHFLNGSIAEAVLNRIDHPIWTWNLKNKTKKMQTSH